MPANQTDLGFPHCGQHVVIDISEHVAAPGVNDLEFYELLGILVPLLIVPSRHCEDGMSSIRLQFFNHPSHDRKWGIHPQQAMFGIP